MVRPHKHLDLLLELEVPGTQLLICRTHIVICSRKAHPVLAPVEDALTQVGRARCKMVARRSRRNRFLTTLTLDGPRHLADLVDVGNIRHRAEGALSTERTLAHTLATLEANAHGAIACLLHRGV